MTQYGIVKNLACKCSKKNNGEFFIKDNRIMCAYCERSIYCKPPIVDVLEATCKCCKNAGVKSTFIVDFTGKYTCTWCGRTR